METGLTPPQCIYPWGLFRRNNQADMKGSSAQLKLCVMFNVVCLKHMHNLDFKSFQF